MVSKERSIPLTTRRDALGYLIAAGVAVVIVFDPLKGLSDLVVSVLPAEPTEPAKNSAPPVAKSQVTAVAPKPSATASEEKPPAVQKSVEVQPVVESVKVQAQEPGSKAKVLLDLSVQESQKQGEVLGMAWLPETVTRWAPLIIEASQKYQVDSKLLASLILCESGGHFCAVSSAGALGLGQVMPATVPNVNLLDPEININAAARYLANMHQRFNDWDKAISAYNGGPGNVSKGTIPNETKTYLKLVGGMWKEADKKESQTFNNWLKAGANSFIGRARKLYNLDPRVLQAVFFATQQWHDKYLLGGEGPDKWDCARLVYFAYKSAGVAFKGSIAGGKVVADQWSSCGRVLAKDEEKLPGDLVVFVDATGKLDHVGMMIYPPYNFIEATGSGMIVRVTSLHSSSKIYRGDLANRVKGFKRVIG